MILYVLDNLLIDNIINFLPIYLNNNTDKTKKRFFQISAALDFFDK